MDRPWTTFGWALGASAALHALVLASVDPLRLGAGGRSMAQPPVLMAWLEPLPEAGARSQARQDQPKPPGAKPPGRTAPPPQSLGLSRQEGPMQVEPLAAAQQAETLERLSQVLLYPPEALRQGLEGEVVLLLELGEGGRIVEASVASSSGHALLDEAALKAVARLGALSPASTGKAILLPVRFRIL
jgi:protein TonB